MGRQGQPLNQESALVSTYPHQVNAAPTCTCADAYHCLCRHSNDCIALQPVSGQSACCGLREATADTSFILPNMLLKFKKIISLYSKPFCHKKFWVFLQTFARYPYYSTYQLVVISPLHIADIPSSLRWQLLPSVTKEINLDCDIRPLVVM